MTNAPTNQTLADALGNLAGHALSSVEFVADYVQLRFDGPTLTAYTAPTVSWGSESHVWGEPGYRDALCRQIGCRIERTAVDDQQVSIAFESGATVLISLRDDDYRGPEALQLLLDKDRIWVV
jgi:hypothetical protein